MANELHRVCWCGETPKLFAFGLMKNTLSHRNPKLTGIMFRLIHLYGFVID